MAEAVVRRVEASGGSTMNIPTNSRPSKPGRQDSALASQMVGALCYVVLCCVVLPMVSVLRCF